MNGWRRVLLPLLVCLLCLAPRLVGAQSEGIEGNRVIKGTLNYCEDAGSTDAYACNLDPAIAAYHIGTIYFFKANTANTGAATLNLNSRGAVPLMRLAGGITTPLADNDIRAGQRVFVIYDGTNMQMLSQVGAGETGTGNVVKATAPTLSAPVIASIANLTSNGVVQTSGLNGTLSVNTSVYTKTIANGTVSLATSAIGSGTCATVQTSSASGVASTDVVTASFDADISGVTGYTAATTGTLRVDVYPTTNTVNVKVCNNTGASITPGAVTLNYRVVR